MRARGFDSGERTRLACWLRRPCRNEFLVVAGEKVRDGEGAVASTQPQGHVQVLTNQIDFGLNGRDGACPPLNFMRPPAPRAGYMESWHRRVFEITTAA